MRTRMTVCAATLAALSCTANADEGPKISFEPQMWYASPGGNIKLGDSPTLPSRKLNVDSPRASPAGRFTLETSDMIFTLDASSVRVAGTSNILGETIRPDFSFIPGDVIRTEFELTMVEPRFRFPLHEYEQAPNANGTVPAKARLDLIAGLRAYDLRIEIERVDGGLGRDEGNLFAVHPTVGLGVAFELYEFMELDVAATLGAFPEVQGVTSASADATAAFRFRVMNNEAGRVSLLGGYRILITSLLDPDEVEFDGALAGLFFGIEWRF